MTWQRIWENKGKSAKVKLGLADLIAIDGYDTATGYFPTKDWLDMIKAVEMKVGLEKDQAICEIGCGAGAFLSSLYQKGYVNISGIDYSENLINICRKVIPCGDFRVAEARKLPFAMGRFDVVLSNGVFFYFPDLEYAEASIKEIIRILKSNGKAAILDINDLAKKEEYEQFKRDKVGFTEYERLYKDLPQLFYSKTWLGKISNKYNLEYELCDQSISGYESSRFRFNFYFSKA